MSSKCQDIDCETRPIFNIKGGKSSICFSIISIASEYLSSFKSTEDQSSRILALRHIEKLFS